MAVRPLRSTCMGLVDMIDGQANRTVYYVTVDSRRLLASEIHEPNLRVAGVSPR